MNKTNDKVNTVPQDKQITLYQVHTVPKDAQTYMEMLTYTINAVSTVLKKKVIEMKKLTPDVEPRAKSSLISGKSK